MLHNQSALKLYGSKEGYDADVLIDSKTMVGKDDFVATGVLTYALGDIMEVELPEYDVFQLGDKVKMVVYSKSGLFVLHTTVIAKEAGSLMVLNPPENRRKFTEKREHARVQVGYSGRLIGLQGRGAQHQLENPITIEIKNISMSGIGFTIQDAPMIDKIIQKQSLLDVELILDFNMASSIEIVRKEWLEEGFYYGASFTSVETEQAKALRGFILRKQIETYFIQKRDLEYQKAMEKKAAASQ
ncbi:PilZ domain-containing protein [Paenibacillus whitsoniae]|uniref:PilZ domain-containing protein n=1 Tax=Paenibacillus whitsoniae TaxID=2496558 RepID=A0A3S0A3Y0_9BACL|nr:PilZ domain-containing protein [Paenibacillus whitsoniae]RTE09000.1 PilZ domain-containing protein [Paenibacillus whitsoniae]